MTALTALSFDSLRSLVLILAAPTTFSLFGIETF